MFSLFKRNNKKRIELIQFGEVYYLIVDGSVVPESLTTDPIEAEKFFNHETMPNESEIIVLKSKEIVCPDI